MCTLFSYLSKPQTSSSGAARRGPAACTGMAPLRGPRWPAGGTPLSRRAVRAGVRPRAVRARGGPLSGRIGELPGLRGSLPAEVR